ncbi:hypothetical protein BO94DRAFT_486455 [Aspergillus sclerotioniger CBS 115572]|uniref:Uncharacterized protein n=1 Tax=Aspergillus sclerotioniger CBS 115572 TaxID=1450535 RepID=A0A317X5C1_9EURO|nr:hypothetical protein BO94DRAFT_486455 [Aspergillus sclerotioniger CBS 115572]PWY93401.1 hypothetical protein BO94DRAFT_486455 [Aspergillus sclerotioniger CBS 115572]
MPPSTVFSYWRREHRRSSASPVSPSLQPTSKGPVANNPSQRSVSPNTRTTLAALGGSSVEASTLQAPSNLSGESDAAKRNIAISVTPTYAPASSSTNLTNPTAVPLSSESHARFHSTPDEREDPTIASQSNYSQSSFAVPRSDHGDGDSPKPSSPFRLSLGKNLLSSHNLTNDHYTKRSSTPGLPTSSHFRFRTSPDISPADRTISSNKDKEYKYENANGRRSGDRDGPTEHVHHKSGKTRLHLLNPMSLLARRRSSNLANLRMEDTSIRARNIVPAIPDDYDPRIRGNIVHDFSAPRPRRNLSTAPVLLHDVNNQSGPPDAAYNGNGNSVHGHDQNAQIGEQRKRHTQYSPVFREHFEDDQKVLQVESKAYLQSSLLTEQFHENDPSALPVFARRLPSKLPDQGGSSESPSDQAAPKQDDQHNIPNTIGIAGTQDADTIEVIPHQPSGLPKHLKSNASRFSFDMNGVESSTQEKLLEEKHKEKEAARRAKARMEGISFSDGEDDFDEDMLDDMDDFEEKIPGVNIDADEDDEFSGFSGPGNALNKSWFVPSLSPVLASPLPPGFNDSRDMQDMQESAQGSLAQNSAPSPVSEPVTSAITTNVQLLSLAPDTSTVIPQVTVDLHPQPSQPMEDDDDLYFDDGEFGDLSTEDAGDKFDESIFDDETSHLYDRKPAAQQPVPEPTQPDDQDVGTNTLDVTAEHDKNGPEPDYDGGLGHAPSIASDYRKGSIRTYGHTHESLPNLGSAKAHGGVLSEHNLEAFHNALAQAASEAAANDRLSRVTSVSERSLGQESTTQTMDTPSGLISDDSRLSQTVDMVGFDEVFEDFSYDDNDAALFDDPIIAAANAEALENDDEGFYGQEFGFYAQSHGGCNAELTNGGYFGPRGVEGITRSFSSRGKFCEPSLTPITERSEWSTRNSVISLTAHGAAHSNPMASPGLAQLVDLGAMDDEMSLSALMKLRRGAWGGSNGSLRSGSGSPPPHLHSSSNRASFISDASPTVYTAPPDAFGGTSATESPIKESDKFRWSQHAMEQRVGQSPVGEREP